MLEYARSRVKLFCIRAATLPKVMVAIATIANVEYQSTLIVDKPTMNTRNAAANAAIFAPEASNALTVVGAPSKASGIHMWKGTTAILTPNPATNITMAIRAKDLVSPVRVPRELAIAGRLVDPVIPNDSDMAKTSRADERADITKNLTAASFELGSFFLIAVRAYVGMLMSSHPT